MSNSSSDQPSPEGTGKPRRQSPGDEAPPGTPGTGENLCRRCSGSGQVEGKPCPDCEGTGYVITGIGGA